MADVTASTRGAGWPSAVAWVVPDAHEDGLPQLAQLLAAWFAGVVELGQPVEPGSKVRRTASAHWNFHESLIDRSGKVTSFDSNVEPESRELTGASEKALAVR